MNHNPRQLLAKIRKGDFAHAGEEEAIDIVLMQLKQLIDLQAKGIKIIDVGCGLGGTAEYLRKKISAHITGIDIDGKAISHAKSHYPEVTFIEGDILNIDTLLAMKKFDLILLFNVFYTFANKISVLQKLANIAKPNGILSIFDYVNLKQDQIIKKDLAGMEMHPILLDEVKINFNKTGWKLIDMIDISDRYEIWYANFLSKLHANKENLLNEFSKQTFDQVATTFTDLLNKIKDKEIGGCIIYAQQRGKAAFVL